MDSCGFERLDGSISPFASFEKSLYWHLPELILHDAPRLGLQSEWAKTTIDEMLLFKWKVKRGIAPVFIIDYRSKCHMTLQTTNNIICAQGIGIRRLRL